MTRQASLLAVAVSISFLLLTCISSTAAADVSVEDAIEVGDPAAVSDEEATEVYQRSIARVEEIRGVELEDPPEFRRISHDEWRNLTGDLDFGVDVEHRVMWRALLMVEDRESVEDVLRTEAAEGTLAFHLPRSNEIYLVSDGGVDERALAHELTHALQHERHTVEEEHGTWDEAQGYAGLYEGEAELVRDIYAERCRESWSCFTGDEPDDSNGVGGEAEEAGDSEDTEGSSLNYGVYAARFHPYSDGLEYVDRVRMEDGGWSEVDSRYEDPPRTTSEVVHHERREPAEPEFADSSDDSWRVLEDAAGQPTFESAGEAALYSMFLHQSLTYLSEPVVSLDGFLDGEGRSVYSYRSDATEGWRGDRLYLYLLDDVEEEAAASEGLHPDSYGFLWLLDWRDDDEAREFHVALERVLRFHGEKATGGWRLSGAFDAGFRVERTGSRVVVVRAPSPAEVDAVAGDVEATYVDAARAGKVERGRVVWHDDGGSPLPQPAPGAAAMAAAVAFTALVSRVRRNS